MSKAVITDIDGTLCDYVGIAWVRFLGANKHVKKEYFEEHENLVEAYRRGLLDHISFTREWVNLYGSMIKGKSVREWERLGRKFCTAFNKGIPAHSMALVKHFKKKKYRIIAITASPSIPANFVLKHMGIDVFYATEPEVGNGKFTGEFSSTMHLTGNGKEDIVREIIMKYGIDTSQSFALGDTVHDLPLLESVANPIAINPKGKLREYAKENEFWIADYSNILDVIDDAEKSGSKSMFEQLKFLYETGGLRYTPRTGWAHIHVENAENVAEHSFRTAIIAFLLAINEGEDAEKCAASALIHDLGEVRVGDVNKITARYWKNKNAAEKEAFIDMIGRLDDKKKNNIENAWKAYGNKSIKIILKDADLLENLITAREYEHKGYVHAREWITRILTKLKTRTAKQWGRTLAKMDPDSWWFGIKTLKIR